MCYNLSEYDPFEPYWQDDYDIASEPMEDYNWEEWLENEE